MKNKINKTHISYLVLFVFFVVSPARGQDETPLVRLFDTVTAAAAPLANDAISKRAGWQLTPEDNLSRPFTGDAVLLNDKLAVVLRKQGGGAEVYSKTPAGWMFRAAAGHLGGPSPVNDPLTSLKIIENNAGAVMLEAGFKSAAGPAALSYRLTSGEAILEIRSGGGAKTVNVDSPTRYVVVPDYFGDDLVYDTVSLRGRGLPAENFCLNCLEGGGALMMSVWQSSQQAPWIETGADGKSCANRIGCVSGKSIWLAFLESPGIWRAAATPASLNGPTPFPAKWRCSFVRENGLADSWSLDRGPGPEQTAGKHTGPVIVYPIDRSDDTPLTAVLPTDIMRNTLGVGPCQYILAVEGLAAEGDPTPNNVMNWVEAQFEHKEEAKTQSDIKERLEQMARHVADARARIQRYGDFAAEARKLLAGKADSEAALAIVADLERFVAAGLAPAASPERARDLAAQVAALIGKENAPGCRQLGGQLRVIGTIQDGALARSRMSVRRLGQEGRGSARAGLARDAASLAEKMLNPNQIPIKETGGVK